VSSDLNQNHLEKDFNQNQSTVVKLHFNTSLNVPPVGMSWCSL